MRVAIISDIHGNVRALEAVLANLRERGPFDGIVNAGDLAMGAARPREVMDLLRAEGFPTIVGNTDQWVGGVAEAPRAARPAVEWTRRQLGSADSASLGRLPMSHRIEPPEGPVLVVVHATPTSTTDSVTPDAPPEALARMLEDAKTRTLAYGHIHRPYVREVPAGTVVNVGSVGLPLDGTPRPAWAILTLEGGRWRAEIVRVTYDHEAAARELLASDHPLAEVFATRIRTASAPS